MSRRAQLVFWAIVAAFAVAVTLAAEFIVDHGAEWIEELHRREAQQERGGS